MFTFAFSSALRSATFQLEYSTEDMVANCIRGLSEKWVISQITVNKSFCFWWQWPFSSYCNCTQTEQQTHKIFSHPAMRMRVTPDRENRFCGTIKPVKNSENGSRADLWRKAMHFNPIWKVHSIKISYLKYYDILVGNCLVRLCQWNNV